MNVSQVTNDILNNPRFEGAISSISWLTDWIDVGFGMAITTVAFLIILVAMFKNVLAGAYCAYPKFWDRVYEAHQVQKEIGFIQNVKNAFQGGGGQVQTMAGGGGGLSQAILGILPDIRSMTDFENETQSPKSYFIKAIPQMLVCVIIGAFIYNGFYRDVASLVVDTGSTLIQRTLLEFDPIAVYDQFTGTAGRPVFLSDDSKDPFEQCVNRLAIDYYTSIIGSYTDITTAEQKRILADACENKARDQLGQLPEAKAGTFTDGENWRMTYRIAWSSENQSELTTDKYRSYAAGSNDTIYQWGDCFSIQDLNIQTIQTHPEAAFVRVMLIFEQQNVSKAGVAMRDGVLVLKSGATDLEQVSQHNNEAGNWMVAGVNKTYNITSEEGNGKGTIKVTVNDSKQLTFTVEITEGNSTGVWKIGGSGIQVQSKDGNGRSLNHAIAYVEIKSDGAGSFYSKSNTGLSGQVGSGSPVGFTQEDSKKDDEKKEGDDTPAGDGDT